ncbi:DUF4861 domain-containing protein [Paludibacter sp. 221]|uniref:DUF4861 domain-containing protein n=1 Tax=Paludibacter sp. 221 TaxID=2302939 RepID=UPI0013D50FC6|nr:DUF4861 domain-containing protein [Paludibacter sp. 221]NDV47096.1 DUF4861 domain-containing protein [Paludibacter sp. 221]
MKKIILFAFILICPAAFCAGVKLTVENPNESAVSDAPVVVVLNELQKIKKEKRGELAVFADGKEISSQLDDLDGDGIVDELVFLMDFAPGEVRNVTLKTIKPSKRKTFPKEVYADLILKEKDGTMKYVTSASSAQNDMYNKLHHHGVAFESALMAYRIYFDNKSTIDIYGKKKKQLELAKTGWYPTDEQLKQGFGDDILRVSGSAGVGTVKGWNGTKAIHIDKFERRTQRIVAQGNLRTVSESIVEGWEYEGKKIDMTVRYIQYARHRDAIAEVTASENIECLATGVQKIANGTLFSDNKGLIGSWGSDYPQNDTVKYSKETVGLGVYVPTGYVKEHTADKVNNLILMTYNKREILRFYLTAVWAREEFSDIKDEKQFFDYLNSWASALQPVVLKYK